LNIKVNWIILREKEKLKSKEGVVVFQIGSKLIGKDTILVGVLVKAYEKDAIFEWSDCDLNFLDIFKTLCHR
jgi:hypothetical protein